MAPAKRITQFHDRSGWSYTQLVLCELVRAIRASSYSFSPVAAFPGTGEPTESSQIKREYDPVLFEETRAAEGPWGSEAFPVGNRGIQVLGGISDEKHPK